MKRNLWQVGFILAIIAAVSMPGIHFGADGQPTDLEKLKQLPITSEGGKVGTLLKQWWKDGTAAGNAGDFYDNRDGE